MITVVVIVSLFCLYLLEPCFFRSLGLSISLSIFGPFSVILIPFSLNVYCGDDWRRIKEQKKNIKEKKRYIHYSKESY